MKDGVPYTAEISVRLKKHLPYSDERTEWLDRLLKHVCLRLSDDGSQEAITFLVDGSEVITVIQGQDGNETLTAILPVSEKLYSGEPFLISGEDDLFGDFLLGTTGKEHLYLESLLHLIGSLPAEFAEQCTESKINSKIKGYGTVKEKKTIVIDSEVSETLAGKLSGMCDTEELAEIINTVTFTGKQNIKLMYDDEGNLIKIVYDGNLNDSNGYKRNVSLSWQHCDGETVKNKVILKTPRNDKKGRDNFIIEESIIRTEDTEQWKAEYTYEAVENGKKDVTEISADLTETSGETLTTLKGNIIINRKQSGADRMKSEFGIDAGFGETRTGTISVRTYRENAALEDAEISFALHDGSTVPDLSGYETDELDPSAHEYLMNGTTAYLLRSLIQLPSEDTVFLSGDMPDETWREIVEAAGKPVKEEDIP